MKPYPFEELSFRGQLPPENKLRNLIEESERFPFDIPTTHTTSDNDIENILQIHRQITGWAVPSEKFLLAILGKRGKTVENERV